MHYEIAYESRKWTQNRTETKETFVYYICDEDLEMDDSYGEFFAPNDDVGLALFIYSVFPDYRIFASPTGPIAIFIDEISALQKVDGGWEVTLTYSPPDARQYQNSAIGGTYVQFGFSTNGDTRKLFRSYEVTSVAKRPDIDGDIPLIYRLIGSNRDTVEGIDISDAGLTFNITGYFNTAVWNTSVLLTFSALTKTYNNSLFYGFPAGEVLLDQVEAQGEVLRITPVTFNFIHSPNQVAVADDPFGPLTALGHDYIDYKYVEEVDGEAVVQWPAYRYVHRVRNPGNFNLLGI
jgi:hypothetical protein